MRRSVKAGFRIAVGVALAAGAMALAAWVWVGDQGKREDDNEA